MTHVYLPDSLPMSVYHFMTGAANVVGVPKRITDTINPYASIDCMVSVNNLATEIINNNGTQGLFIGDKKLTHICDNIYTVHGLTREDLKTIYESKATFNLTDLVIQVTQKVNWIEKIEPAVSNYTDASQ